MNDLQFSHIRTFECLSKQYTSSNKNYKLLNYSEDEDEEKEQDLESNEKGRELVVNFIFYLDDKKRDKKAESKRKEDDRIHDRNKLLVATPKVVHNALL